MRLLNLIKYNLYEMFSIKKLSIIFSISLLSILYKIFQYNFLNKFISVFGSPVNASSSDILSTILFYFLILILLKDNFIDNYINRKFLTLPKIKNINLWIIGILLSYIIALFLYFFISFTITSLIHATPNNLYNLMPRVNINKIILNLIILNILISFTYVLNFICIYVLSKSSALATIINLCIMFFSYVLCLKSKTIPLYLPTSQGNIRTYMLNNYSFINSYIIVFITIVLFLIIIFSSKKSYLI